MKAFFLNRILPFIVKKKEKIIRVSLGLLLVLSSALLLFINPEPIATWVEALEKFEYDLQVRHMHKPIGKNVPITIVDIDDKTAFHLICERNDVVIDKFELFLKRRNINLDINLKFRDNKITISHHIC